MRNIFIALPNDTLGGAEQYLKMVAEFFLEDGYQVWIFFLKKKETGDWEYLKKYKNVNILYTSSQREKNGVFSFLENIFKYRNVHFEYTFTSHVHVTGLLGFMRKLGIVKTKSFIGRESTSIFERFSGLKRLSFKFTYFLGYSAIDLLICQSDLMKNQLLSSLPWLNGKTKVRVIGNPININLINKEPIKIGYNFPFVVAAGRLIQEKGFDLLINSFSILKSRNPELKLVILGEGKMRNELERLILDNELMDDVILHGFVKNVYPYFKAAKLCVVSSRIEGFPNVLLQMMSQNHKVVSTKCAGGIEEIQGVFTAETNSVESLTQAMSLANESDTSMNRNLFDDFLKARSIENFIKKIEFYISQ